MILSAHNLKKSFGTTVVLNQVSFQAASGSAMGLLGRNGAGKTTTIRIIMQVFQPDEGSVLLDGRPLGNSTASIGYLPEEKGLYPKQRISDQLVYLARLRGMSLAGARRAVSIWLDRLDLSGYLDQKLETLSKGNQQKIQLALALLHDPDIIILDEPFSGLDPVNAQLLKEIVQEQVQSGKIVLFSSHQMNYVEQFCDHVAILHQGAIQVSGSIRDLKRSNERNRLRLRFADQHQPGCRLFEHLLAAHPEARALVVRYEPMADDCLVALHHESGRRRLFQLLADSGIDLEQFQVIEPSLEDIFIAKVGDALC